MTLSGARRLAWLRRSQFVTFRTEPVIELDCNGEYAAIARRVGIKKIMGLLDDWSTTIADRIVSRTPRSHLVSAASKAEGGGWWAAQTAAADRYDAVAGRDSRFYGSRLENPDSKVLFAMLADVPIQYPSRQIRAGQLHCKFHMR